MSLTRLCGVGVSLAGRVVVLSLILQLFLGWEVPLGDVGPVVHIKVPPVLSRRWDKREIERENRS